MNLKSGRDIRGERAKRNMTISWFSKQLGMQANVLSIIEIHNLPLSDEIINKAADILVQFDSKAA
jgi:hypothetical protein